MKRLIALVLAYFFLVLALIGVFLPLVPTVPFLLLTAWFSAKGSERLHRWLYAHPYLSKPLIDWENNRSISCRSKIVMVVMLSISWGFLYFRLNNIWLLVLIGLLFMGLSAYLISRPHADKLK